MNKFRVWEIIPDRLYQSPQYWRESDFWKERELSRFNVVVSLTRVFDDYTNELFGNKYLHIYIPDGNKFDSNLISLLYHLSNMKHK